MIQKQKTIYNCVLQQIMGSTIISRYNILTTFIDLSFKHLILVYNNKKVIMFFFMMKKIKRMKVKKLKKLRKKIKKMKM